MRVEPRDRYNLELVAQVHPEGWKNPTPRGRYNLIVLGGGTAGLISAAVASSLGARVALVERHLLGGDCLNVGCVPSKGIIRAARALEGVRFAEGFGVRLAGEVGFDFSAAMERMRRIRSEISHHDSAVRYRDEFGVDLYLGEGRFAGPGGLEVEGERLEFAKAIIATGARPAVPPIPGLEESGYLTNETIFTLTELPRRLAVIGAGPIGAEMAQTFRRFGSEVYLIEMADRVLPREDRDVAEFLRLRLEEEGVEIRTATALEELSARGEEKLLRLGGGEEIAVDHLLLSIGRAPNVENLGLENVGVSYDRRTGIEVNSYLQTTNRRIFAAGDVAYQYKFTHAAEATAAIAVQNALFLRTKKSDGLVVPWCTYTSPEVAHVGLSEEEARGRGIEIESYRHEIGETDRGRLDGSEGFVKLHARKGKLVGGTIVADHAGEMVGELALAIQKGLSLGDLNGVIHPYPTQAEAIKRAAAGVLKAKLTPRAKRFLDHWMRWRR
ncbi:MAG: mercuric reductase [Spirochaetaceae bacterium]